MNINELLASMGATVEASKEAQNVPTMSEVAEKYVAAVNGDKEAAQYMVTAFSVYTWRKYAKAENENLLSYEALALALAEAEIIDRAQANGIINVRADKLAALLQAFPKAYNENPAIVDKLPRYYGGKDIHFANEKETLLIDTADKARRLLTAVFEGANFVENMKALLHKVNIVVTSGAENAYNREVTSLLESLLFGDSVTHVYTVKQKSKNGKEYDAPIAHLVNNTFVIVRFYLIASDSKVTSLIYANDAFDPKRDFQLGDGKSPRQSS